LALRAYISNISPLWPVEQQEAALKAALPGWPDGVMIFRDVLDTRARRAHRISSLIERADMLRASTRRSPGSIYLASLAPLAWTAEDLMECLSLAAAKNATVHVLDAGLVIPPSPGAEALHQAAIAFRKARERQSGWERGKRGGQASGEMRSAAAKERAETIRERWALPTADYPTIALLAEAGISLNTAKMHLKPRPIAQREREAAQKRKAARAAKGSAA
jgi:hypothetical protein